MSMHRRSGKVARWCIGLLATWGISGFGSATAPAAAQAPPRVLVHDRAEPRVLERGLPGAERLGMQAHAGDPARGSGDPVCDAASVAWHGQPLLDGEQGTLAPAAFVNPATMNDQGRVAFFAQVEGAERNQGIFTADPEGLHIVALGCGGPGGSGQTAGCGDPSPVGGTFSGFFSGTFFVPDINDAGDVLFLADIHEGDFPRGLFVYRADTDEIQPVAVVGQAIPGVGAIAEIGSGNLNNAGFVVFAAKLTGSGDAGIFLWTGGLVLPYVAVGDPAPGGGVFTGLVTESLGFPDGTSMPGGPLPGWNDQGQVSFRGIVDGGEASRGIFSSQGFQHEWLVRAGDPVPGGGTYVDFQAPLLNEAGEVAFFADIDEAGEPNSAWIAGSPGDWRRAVAFFEPVGDAVVWGMAFSRNPLAALDDQGDLILWIDRLFPDQSTAQAVILSHADGERVIVAAQGEPTPEGGTWGSINAWPAQNDADQGHVGAGTPGLPGQPNTHFALTFCGGGSDPTLDVDPDSLAVTLESGQSQTEILALSNLGDATLDWDQFGGEGCVLPSWVSAQPFGGSIPGGGSQEMSVTFDAAGVPTGTHSATLCLISNDPANPMVTVPLSLTVTPAEGPTILFNQLTNVPLVGAGMPVQVLVPPHPFDAEGADDFQVFDAEGWTIGELVFGTPHFGLPGNPGLVDVRVYPDAGGEPGEPALCDYDGIAAAQHGTLQLRVPLPTPCLLGPGRYWVSLQRRGGLLRWSVGAPAPLPPPFILGEHAHWRNPGDGWDTGCTDWSDITTCLVEGEPVAGSFDSQALFQVCGAVGMDPGDFAGCGNEDAGLDLTITLAVDNGDPEQCGTATALDVEAGDRVNVCYTVTNTGDAMLRYHWLRDGRPPRPLAREQALEPGQSLELHRLITAAASQTLSAEAQATDVLPWYFGVQQGFDFIDISGSGTALDLGDDGSANVTLPFRFPLFGVASDQLCINNNGFVLLDWSKSCDGFHRPYGIPTSGVSSALIAPFWDDLFTGGNVYYDVIGEQPNRRFIIQWHEKNHYDEGASDPGAVTFELILDEATQAVSFQYLDTIFGNPQHPEWDRGGRAAVGFQSYWGAEFGGAWRIHSNFQPVLEPESGLTWRPMGGFHAMGSATATLAVHAPAIAVSPEALSATVEQGGSTSLPLTINNTGDRELLWKMGASPLSARSHFPRTPVPLLTDEGADEPASPPVDLWDLVPDQKPTTFRRGGEETWPLDGFATRAFAVRYQFDVPPFGVHYDRLNDLADPSDTDDLGSLLNRNIFAGAFIGTDFSRQLLIDENKQVFTVDTTTAEESFSLGLWRGSPGVVIWRGLTWDETTSTLYALGTDTFGFFPDTRFFLGRIDLGHEPQATTIGELPGIAQGVGILAIAVDPLGRMFATDALGDRLFAIDKETAEAMPIGPLGFDANGQPGLDFDDATSQLYFASIDDASSVSNLYTVNTLTGEASLVGPLGNGTQRAAMAIASGAPCVPPTEVPWLSLDPAAGSTVPGGSDEVTVLLDAGELDAGTHEAHVCVVSNDPLRPVASVPLSLTVTGGGEDPVIDVDPDSIESTLPSGGTETRGLTISNLGGGTLEWEVTEESGAGARVPRPVVSRLSGLTVGAHEGRRRSRTVMTVNEEGALQVPDAIESEAVTGRAGFVDPLSPRTTVWSRDDEVSIAASVAIDDLTVWGAWQLNGSRLGAHPVAGDGTPVFEVPAQHVDGFVGSASAKGADRALFLERDLFTGDENIRIHAFTSQSDGTPDWSFEFPSLVGSAPGFRNVAVSFDGSTVAATGFRDVGGEEESTLYVLDAATGDVISTWIDPSRMQAVDLTDDGSLALVSQDAQATLVETATGEVVFQTPGSGGNSINFRISGDGGVFVVGGFDFDVYRFDGDTYSRVIHFTRPSTWFGQASVVSRDGSTAATFGSDFSAGWLAGEVFLFDVASGEMLGSFPVSGSGEFQGTPVDAASNDDGSVMAFASWGTQNNDWPEIMVFNRDVELISQIDFPGSALAVDVSPDGRYVVGGAKATHANEFATGGRIELIEIEGGEPGGCALPEWVSVDPASGSVPGGESQAAGVTFDAAGLEPGDYEANLCIASNDPVTPRVTVPLHLTVEGGGDGPIADITPGSFTFEVPEGGSDSATLNMGNVGLTDLVWSLEEAEGPVLRGGIEVVAGGDACDSPSDVPWLATSPTSGTTPPDGSVPVTVSVDATGLGAGEHTASLCVTTNDPAAERVQVQVNLLVTEGPLVGFAPVALVVDPVESVSDGNGVLEPGEMVDVAPSWQNLGEESASLTGTATGFTGPEGGEYTIAADFADHGLVAGGETTSCLEATGTCYALGVEAPGGRPAMHWEATFDESLDDPAGTTHTWTLHIGESFVDVPVTHLFYSWVETLLHNGVTEGCAAEAYCPSSGNTRAQMSVFLLRAAEGGDYAPPACVEGEELFDDVSFDNVFCPWIQELAGRAVTAGCGGDNYCPGAAVSRAQMAVFLLRTLEGEEYVPPSCAGVFADVPCPSLFADWVEDLASREITAGCGGDNYCPATTVSRGQMAVFLTKTFGLTLYGP